MDPASADAVLCVDAIQFAQPPAAAYRELRRVLGPGGRAVLTCWEPLDRTDDLVPERLRGVDLGTGLSAAGFEVEVRERPGWRTAERSMWEEGTALDPGDDPALRSFHDEGVRSLAMFDRIRPGDGDRDGPAHLQGSPAFARTWPVHRRLHAFSGAPTGVSSCRHR